MVITNYADTSFAPVLTNPSLAILNDIAGPHVHHVVSKEKTL